MWEAIESNRRRSRILVAGMGLLLLAMGSIIGYAVAPRGGLTGGLLVALGVWGVLWLIAAFQGDRIMLGIAGATKIEQIGRASCRERVCAYV